MRRAGSRGCRSSRRHGDRSGAGSRPERPPRSSARSHGRARDRARRRQQPVGRATARLDAAAALEGVDRRPQRQRRHQLHAPRGEQGRLLRLPHPARHTREPVRLQGDLGLLRARRRRAGPAPGRAARRRHHAPATRREEQAPAGRDRRPRARDRLRRAGLVLAPGASARRARRAAGRRGGAGNRHRRSATTAALAPGSTWDPASACARPSRAEWWRRTAGFEGTGTW